ncbi:MAG: helix-turn-helix domain-containing protein [Magnetococcales bacterium]|nr:helix-turn-helix domain-containing protein [Magnetococcales bacterium]
METRHLNPFQLSRRWGINPKTLQNWRSQGRGPAFLKVGGHVLYRMEDIERYEQERLQVGTTATKLA